MYEVNKMSKKNKKTNKGAKILAIFMLAAMSLSIIASMFAYFL